MLIERNGVLGVEVDGRFVPAMRGGTGVEIAAVAVMAVGAITAAYGAYTSAQNQQAALKYNARVAENDAAATRAAGQAAAERQRRRDRAQLLSFGAAAGRAGVVARAGSSLLAELDFAEGAELEAKMVQHGYDTSAVSKANQAKMLRWQAGTINPTLAGVSSLLSSSGSIAGSYSTSLVGAQQTGGGLGAGTQAPKTTMEVPT